MKKLLVAAVAVLCVVSVTSAGLQEGVSELQVSGTIQNVDIGSYSESSISGQVNYNYFVMDDVSIGGVVRAQISEPDEGDTSSQIFLLGRGDYYLGELQEDTVPYVGGQLGLVSYESGGESEAVWTYGVHGGVKIFATENTSWNIEGDVTFYSSDEFDEDVTVTSLLFGFSYYFM